MTSNVNNGPNHLNTQGDFQKIPSQKSVILQQILTRGIHFAKAIDQGTYLTATTLLGICAGVGAICTLGKHKATLDFACKYISSSDYLLAEPYKQILKTINPEAIIDRWSGFTIPDPTEYLSPIAIEFQSSPNFLKRHLVSRLTFALTAIVCIITRIVEGIISLPLVALSIITVGKFQGINSSAYTTLQASRILCDLFLLTICILNPADGTKKIS